MAKDSPEVLALARRIFHGFSRFALCPRGEVAKRCHVSRFTIRTIERRASVKIARALLAKLDSLPMDPQSQ